MDVNINIHRSLNNLYQYYLCILYIKPATWISSKLTNSMFKDPNNLVPGYRIFLAAQSSSRSLVVGLLVAWSVGWSVGLLVDLCEKVTFRVSNGN